MPTPLCPLTGLARENKLGSNYCQLPPIVVNPGVRTILTVLPALSGLHFAKITRRIIWQQSGRQLELAPTIWAFRLP